MVGDWRTMAFWVDPLIAQDMAERGKYAAATDEAPIEQEAWLPFVKEPEETPPSGEEDVATEEAAGTREAALKSAAEGAASTASGGDGAVGTKGDAKRGMAWVPIAGRPEGTNNGE